MPRSLITLMLLALAAAVFFATDVVAREGGGRHHEPLQIRLGLQAGYDDNILQLSREEIDRLEEQSDPDRFLIETEDDLVTRAQVQLRWRVPHRGPRRTILRPRVDLYRYSRNGIKDYEVWGVRLSQEVNTSRRHRSWFGGSYRRIASRYSREVTDDDRTAAAGTRIRDSLRYSEDRYAVSYRQRIRGRRLEAGGRLRVRDRQYVAPFRERDGIRTEASLGLQGRPLRGSRFEVEGRIILERYDAEGDLETTPIEDDDVSFRSRGAALALEVPAGRRAELDFLVELERRDYTTDKRDDRSRFEREDLRLRFRLGYAREVIRDLVISGAFQLKAVDATLPVGNDALDEQTDYVESRLTLGIVWDLEL